MAETTACEARVGVPATEIAFVFRGAPRNGVVFVSYRLGVGAGGSSVSQFHMGIDQKKKQKSFTWVRVQRLPLSYESACGARAGQRFKSSGESIGWRSRVVATSARADELRSPLMTCAPRGCVLFLSALLCRYAWPPQANPPRENTRRFRFGGNLYERIVITRRKNFIDSRTGFRERE